MSDIWDVVIVGAGPAGLALARGLRLALPNVGVLLLERAEQAAQSVRVGESLPGAASALLSQLGLLDDFLAGPHRPRGAAVATWDTTAPIWQDGLMDPQGPGWHLDRRAFEQLLLQGALSAGASIYWGQRITQVQRCAAQDIWQLTVEQAGLVQHYRARILVDATGRNASVANKLGVRKTHDDSLVCAHAFLTVDNSSIAADKICIASQDTTTRLAAGPDGWWYTVKLPNGLRVLAYHLDAQDPNRQAIKTPEIFLAQARKLPLLAEVLTGYSAAPVQFRAAGTSLLDLIALQQNAPGLLTIGDTAITFDPVSSQGLFHALASAASALKAIQASSLAQPNPCLTPAAMQPFFDEMHRVAQRYLQHWRHTYGGPQRFSARPFWCARRERAALN